jgi:branched-subunit amino acid ABC-type transport system permease component
VPMATLIANLIFHASALVLTSLSLAIVFGRLGIMNMAHGEFVMLGAFAVIWVQGHGLPFVLAPVLAFATCAALGFAVERFLIRPLQGRALDTITVTWGLSILLRKTVEALFGRQYQNAIAPVDGSLTFLGLSYPAYRVYLVLSTWALVGALALWYFKSGAGTKLRAAVGNPALAQAVGIDVVRLRAVTFAFAMGLSGIAGALIAPLVKTDPSMGIDFLLPGFFTLIVGGLGTLAGLVTGSGVISGTRVLVSEILGTINGYVAVLILSILFLWWRPRGIFASR